MGTAREFIRLAYKAEETGEMDTGGGRARVGGGEETVSEEGELGKSWDCGDQQEQSGRQDGPEIPVGLVTAI